MLTLTVSSADCGSNATLTYDPETDVVVVRPSNRRAQHRAVIADGASPDGWYQTVRAVSFITCRDEADLRNELALAIARRLGE